ncbi:MAG: hypothetical protein ACJAVI_006153 [Candidatus Azotimanducaceae bacterium]|jgi:uncharacterized protein (TIGR02118 family)
MQIPTQLELCATYRDQDTAQAVAKKFGGRLYIDERAKNPKQPFTAMVCVQTDDIAALIEGADVGVYLVARRQVKEHTDPKVRMAGSIGAFSMIKHPSLSHTESDSHWRDNHAPLALEIHTAMSHYTQLSILHCFKGPELDGIALCGFDSLEDLKERFFNSKEGEQRIAEDVAKFADTRNSPRRVIVKETDFG